MNFLFIPAHVVEKSTGQSGFASLRGARAAQAVEDHDLKSGLSIACVVERQGRGRVEIASCSRERIDMHFCLNQPLPPRTEIALVVAYARPQTVKKILQLGAATGLSSLSFVKTENVVDSYLDSKVFLPEEIERQFTLGCEQVGDGKFPQLRQFKSLKSFLASPDLFADVTQKLFGHATRAASRSLPAGSKLLFLGPESGFTEDERESLKENGFESFSLGERSYRQEIAAALALGALCAR